MSYLCFSSLSAAGLVCFAQKQPAYLAPSSLVLASSQPTTTRPSPHKPHDTPEPRDSRTPPTNSRSPSQNPTENPITFPHFPGHTRPKTPSHVPLPNPLNPAQKPICLPQNPGLNLLQNLISSFQRRAKPQDPQLNPPNPRLNQDILQLNWGARQPPDLRPEAPELGVKLLITPVHVVQALYVGPPLSRQPGENKRCARPQIRCLHLHAVQGAA
jgi:hypothetical protein